MSKGIRISRILLVAAGLVLAPMPPLQAAEPTNFVSRCTYSHSAPDDPIVFPQQPGASHLHDFFANRTTNASSTYESLRRGESTCRIEGDKAAYWTPALFDSGELVEPMYASVYYNLGGKPKNSIRAFPPRLKVVAKDSNVRVTWSCLPSGPQRQSEPPSCPEESRLVLHHRFPDCWDGRRIDSPDHTSHMTFSRRGACPSSHPRPMPSLNLNVNYPSDGGEVVLGSPDMPVAPHADFINSWDQAELERLVRVCLNRGRNCGARPPGT